MSARYVFVLMLSSCLVATAEEKPAAPAYYEEEVAASNPLRSEQAKELDAYVNALKQDESRLRTVFQPDYTSPAAFEKSAQPLRHVDRGLRLNHFRG